MDETTMRRNLSIVVALNCEGVSDEDLSRAFLAVIQDFPVKPGEFQEPFASLFEGNGKMHEETKRAFMAYVDRHFAKGPKSQPRKMSYIGEDGRRVDPQ